MSNMHVGLKNDKNIRFKPHRVAHKLVLTKTVFYKMLSRIFMRDNNLIIAHYETVGLRATLPANPVAEQLQGRFMAAAFCSQIL